MIMMPVNRGNFLSLLHFLETFDEKFKHRFECGPKNAKWVAHSIQNEIIACLADIVQDEISNQVISANYYTIIVDETKDVSKKSSFSLLFVTSIMVRHMNTLLDMYMLRN